MNNILVDIDGTVSEDIPNEEEHRFSSALPLVGAVDSVNRLYCDGNIITFFTARKEKHREVTEQWLLKHGFRYHHLILNKPRGGNYIWIDNLTVKGVLYDDNWSEIRAGLLTASASTESSPSTS
jgi:uncharacterized HAD superfamily protein